MTKPRAVVSWSGGKDCCLALHRARARFEIAGLVTMLTEDGSRTRSHGLPPRVVQAQAQALNLPLLTIRSAWAGYEAQFVRVLEQARRWKVTHAVFGDVFPDAHRRWAETVSRRAGLAAVEPLWGEATHALVAEFIALGGRAVITTVRQGVLERDLLGRTLTRAMLRDLVDKGVDPGGEYGEYHTVVTAFPGFSSEIVLDVAGSLAHGGCFLLDVNVATAANKRRIKHVA